MDGVAVDLADLRGGPVLLVNWSPGCGYCVMIAAELDALQADMAERGTRLLLVAAGDAASNRALLADLEVDLPVVLRSGADDDFVDPFPRMGTPAAYLLDADGRVAAPLVSGAYQVPTLARLAAGKVVAAGRRPRVAAPPATCRGRRTGCAGPGRGRVPVPVPGARRPSPARGRPPSPTGSATTTWASAPTRPPRPTSSAASSPPTTSATTPTSRPTSRSCSATIAGASAASRPARDLKILLQGSASVIRSRSSRRVLSGLASFLAAYLPDADAPGDVLLRTRNLALVVDGEAVLLPPAVRTAVEQLQPRVARFGAQVVDEPTALLDPVRRELVVAEPALTLDRSVLDGLVDPPSPSRSEPPAVVAGRYPLRAWVMWDSGDPDAPELTPAEALTQALTTLPVPPGRLLATADLLADLLAATPPVFLSTTGGDITDQLRPHLT